MASQYRNFLRLLESWPIDKTKTYRDLGLHIREQVKANFASGGISTNISEQECDQTYNSLKRLCDNYYGNLHVRHSRSSASGLTAEQCNSVLSTEFLEYLDKNDSFLNRLIKK
ncbi:ubiquinol-cytochrome-c reductase complex assembly factor 2 [Macrosteles quadrilineatus]|uniref:ubiquinol-cytochrome-c reductase complex assembly factor 2 n=1 Tax=Macrosteles quadrilineatus TaxID=74068 RepID=UPI0023E119DF|nr:ubiquinol-cytochrome-c reductase complex assembly factor 2 [Macrosteles quadrilineatus]